MEKARIEKLRILEAKEKLEKQIESLKEIMQHFAQINRHQEAKEIQGKINEMHKIGQSLILESLR